MVSKAGRGGNNVERRASGKLDATLDYLILSLSKGDGRRTIDVLTAGLIVIGWLKGERATLAVGEVDRDDIQHLRDIA